MKKWVGGVAAFCVSLYFLPALIKIVIVSTKWLVDNT